MTDRMLVHLPTNPDNTVTLAVYDFRGLAERIKAAKPGSIVIYTPKFEKAFFKGKP